MTDTNETTAKTVTTNLKKPFYPEGTVGTVVALLVSLTALIAAFDLSGLISFTLLQTLTPLLIGTTCLFAVPVFYRIVLPLVALALFLAFLAGVASIGLALVAIVALALLIAYPFQGLSRHVRKGADLTIDAITKGSTRTAQAFQ